MERTLYDICRAYIKAVDWYETHPEDPHGEASVDYVKDELENKIIDMSR